MLPIRVFLFGIIVLISTSVVALDKTEINLLGSWIFSGTVTNELGDKYGYFFEMKREGAEFHAKAALIDGQTNQLVFFYENQELIGEETALDWHVGHSFMHFNPINESWIFGVRDKDKKGFNFKVDLLKQNNGEEASLVLSSGVKLQAVQTNQLNGHLQIDEKEQFVTANKAWFGKLIISSEEQKIPHNINTAFCHLNDDNSFYSANIKERDAMSAAVAGWVSPTGNRMKMSQFVSIKSLDNNQWALSLNVPKLTLKLSNTLEPNNLSHAIAGFSKENKGAFCFVTAQLFQEKAVV